MNAEFVPTASAATVRQDPRVAWRSIDGEAVLIDPSNGTVFVLNRLGARIWELLEEPRTTEDLVASVDLDVAPPEETVAADIATFLAALAERRLVEPA